MALASAAKAVVHRRGVVDEDVDARTLRKHAAGECARGSEVGVVDLVEADAVFLGNARTRCGISTSHVDLCAQKDE